MITLTSMEVGELCTCHNVLSTLLESNGYTPQQQPAHLPQDEVHRVRQRVGEHHGRVDRQRGLQRLLRAHVLARPENLHVLEGLELGVDLQRQSQGLQCKSMIPLQLRPWNARYCKEPPFERVCIMCSGPARRWSLLCTVEDSVARHASHLGGYDADDAVQRCRPRLLGLAHQVPGLQCRVHIRNQVAWLLYVFLWQQQELSTPVSGHHMEHS
jgi:hypothetical protein